MAETRTLTVARNERTSLYEVHREQCAHLISKHLHRCFSRTTDQSAAEFAAEFEAGNDDCLTKLGPCVKESA